jgi:hypothetical protein
MSAVGSEADMPFRRPDFRFGPTTDIGYRREKLIGQARCDLFHEAHLSR